MQYLGKSRKPRVYKSKNGRYFIYKHAKDSNGKVIKKISYLRLPKSIINRSEAQKFLNAKPITQSVIVNFPKSNRPKLKYYPIERKLTKEQFKILTLEDRIRNIDTRLNDITSKYKKSRDDVKNINERKQEIDEIIRERTETKSRARKGEKPLKELQVEKRILEKQLSITEEKLQETEKQRDNEVKNRRRLSAEYRKNILQFRDKSKSMIDDLKNDILKANVLPISNSFEQKEKEQKVPEIPEILSRLPPADRKKSTARPLNEVREEMKAKKVPSAEPSASLGTVPTNADSLSAMLERETSPIALRNRYGEMNESELRDNINHLEEEVSDTVRPATRKIMEKEIEYMKRKLHDIRKSRHADLTTETKYDQFVRDEDKHLEERIRNLVESPSVADTALYRQEDPEDKVHELGPVPEDRSNNIADTLNIQGSGLSKRNKLVALWNDQIEDYFKNQPLFSGTIASDEISQLPIMLPQGFIMNTAKSTDPEGEHWVACYITPDSLEYYDPLGEPPAKDFMPQISKKIYQMKLPVMLKFKINRVKDQDNRTNYCGYHCIRFLDDRFHGIPYELTTRWSTPLKDESKEGKGDIKSEFKLI